MTPVTESKPLTFERLWREGQAMSVEAALAEADNVACFLAEGQQPDLAANRSGHAEPPGTSMVESPETGRQAQGATGHVPSAAVHEVDRVRAAGLLTMQAPIPALVP